jgi:hypothetical protein
MKLRSQLLCFVLFTISFPFFAAEVGEVEQIIKINWNKPIEVNSPYSGHSLSVLSFENAVYESPETHCPVYQNRIKIDGDNSSALSISQMYFESLSVEEIKAIPNPEDIADSVTLNYHIVKERKQSFWVYSFVPVRKNPQTGKLEALKYFSLKEKGNNQFVSLKSMDVKSTSKYVYSSVLASGKWAKVLVSKSGVYRITYDELVSLGFSSPSQVRIFGNGGKDLPEVYADSALDDLNEIPVQLYAGADGIFNSGDYIYFYAEGPVTWSYNATKKRYTHVKHPFASKVPYFITVSEGGKKIETYSPSLTANAQSSSFDGLFYHEENNNNLLGSGRTWYGEVFGTVDSYSFTFSIPNFITTEPVKVAAQLVGSSSVLSAFVFSMNSAQFGSVNVPAKTESQYGRVVSFYDSAYSSRANTSVSIYYNQNNVSSAQGWLQYLDVIARQNIDVSSGQLQFRDSRTLGSGKVTLFSVSGAGSNTLVWDVTYINKSFRVGASLHNNILSFTATSDELHEYVAFDPTADLLSPEFVTEDNGAVSNQDLHGLAAPDMVIVSHPDFLSQANKLAALHLEHDGLKSVVVTPQQIYNEFSSGMPSPAAIRNFMKMFYDRAGSAGSYPKYLLLFGDGSYDNRPESTPLTGNTNYIITYESDNSLSESASYVSDDYFGLLDDDETASSGLLDIGIGRLPVQDTVQANAMVNKVSKYYSQESMSDWRTNICFVADDEDSNSHMAQADSLASYYVANKLPSLNTYKIYCDAFTQVPTSTGQRYPEVNTAIRNQLNRGILILNYTGHGGERGLAQEQIMQQADDIKKWNNDKYPLFVTATCEFSRFDNYKQTTAGEDVLLNENGGGIGLLTTTRIVYSDLNLNLNICVYKNALTRSSDNSAFRLGDIARITKNNAGSSVNKLCFTLLGDPALSLAIPKYNIKTDSINHKPLRSADSLKAYAAVEISGHIEDESGNLLSNFNGVVNPTVFDKSHVVTTLANDGGDPFTFDAQENILFRGTASVKNGYFSYKFILPRDMDYDYGNGRLSYYATDFTEDAWGKTSDSVIVGGISNNSYSDNSGPQIKLYMNDTTFTNGGITDENPVLLAKVVDEYGVNSGGNGIGHDIVAVLDNDPSQSYVLNNFYQSDLDAYWKGTIEYQLSQLAAGNHTITLKVWDIFNNSSEASLDFVVPGGNAMQIQKLYNYPNPFISNTWFVFEHNRPDEDLTGEIEIYNFAGMHVRTLTFTLNSSGYTSGPIYWDGTSNGKKISTGIYIYRVILRSSTERTISKAQKMIIIK